MAFIDELKFHIKAGDGGDGVERWHHEKGKEFMGPSGGDGGKGGDVYIRGKKDSSLLRNYANKKKFVAENGQDGAKSSLHGKNGEDLIIDLPVGSIVTNLDTGEKHELMEQDQQILILKGGQGGYGNEHFKSSTNINPTETTDGKSGEEADFNVEIQLIADAGLIGFPNAGKSTLLNSLTNAKSKIGSFEFTTLEPHLGQLFEFTLADIPGLIEGASEGRGIGDKFLRHINRTKILLHCIDSSSEDIIGRYKTIRTELELFDPKLIEKKEIIILTKTDEISEEDLKQKIAELKSENENILSVTTLSDESIKELSDALVKELRS